MAGVDDVDRKVEFRPSKGIPCDPRHMIVGHDDGLDGTWTSGFFDRGDHSRWRLRCVFGDAFSARALVAILRRRLSNRRRYLS